MTENGRLFYTFVILMLIKMNKLLPKVVVTSMIGDNTYLINDCSVIGLGRGSPTSNFWSEVFPHLKIPRDAGKRKGGTQRYAINVHFKIHVAISVN